MILEDEELNFAIPQEPEFRVVRRRRRVHPVQQAADDGILAFLIPATLLVFALLIGSALHPPTPNPPTTQLNEGSSPSQNVQTSQNENQASHPEYFPAGWDYITSPQSTETHERPAASRAVKQQARAQPNGITRRDTLTELGCGASKFNRNGAANRLG